MDYDVVIYGAGHTGTCLKATLSKIKGLKVLLLHPDNHFANFNPKLPQRLFAISDGSLKILKEMAGEEFWLHMGQPIKHIKVIEGESKASLDFSPSDINAEDFGYMIQEDSLYSALDKLGSSVSLQNASILSIKNESHNTTIELNNGKTVTASLLIAADGKHSYIRKLLGAPGFKHDYRQYGLVCEVEHANNHHGTAVEKFISSGPFAILPRKGGYSSAVVWSIKKEWRQAYEKLPIDLQHDLILQHFPKTYGKARVSSLVQLFPLHLHILKNPVHGRVVFVGDAAHAIHPLAGQGFNLTIRDIEILSQGIAENKHLGLDVGCPIMLGKYFANRQLDINIMAEATHYLNALFSNDSKIISMVRGLGLKAVDKNLFIKKYFMKYALGHIS